MAGTAVASWAVFASPQTKIVGDVLAATGREPHQRHLMVAPRLIEPRRGNLCVGNTLWATGTSVCGRCNVREDPTTKVMTVNAIHCISYFGEGAEPTWVGRYGCMKTSELQGTVSSMAIRMEHSQKGEFCGEWLPYFPIRELFLYDPAGHAVNPNTAYRALCHDQTMLKDIVHWRWSQRGNLQLTALAEVFTGVIRRQLSHLMYLLVLNFPAIMRGAGHAGRIRYSTREGKALREYNLTTDRRIEREGAGEPEVTDRHPIAAHGDLVSAMQRIVGGDGVGLRVHPHPQLARMVCLWAGDRRWALKRKRVKEMLRRNKFEQGRTLLRAAARKWRSHSAPAARGLEQLKWRSIRRVVGLTPWGEQVLLRLKHHAVSVYNPISAGLHCPFVECGHLRRVDLYHIFWTCPAAVRLQKVLLKRWRAAGLGPGSHEEEFFALQLQQSPQELLQASGRILADSVDGSMAQVADSIEATVAQCWGVGAALYFYSAWRWRIAHFDPHNDVTAAHHEAVFATRLRRSHASITASNIPGYMNYTLAKVQRTICAMLGGGWQEHIDAPVRSGACLLLFSAGSAVREDEPGVLGVMAVRTQYLTGRCQVAFMSGTRIQGKLRCAQTAAHLSLVNGLRRCHRLGWKSIHVIGDNKVAIRQQEARTPPRRAASKGSFWKERRMADAMGVMIWHTHPREKNKTVHAIMTVVKDTTRDMEWNAMIEPDGHAKWAAVLATVEQEVQFWWITHGDTLSEHDGGSIV